MSREKQIEEMRYLADEMGKAISTEYEKRVLADERKLEAVLKENGWRKASEVAEEIIETLESGMEEPITEWHKGYLAALSDVVRMLKKKYTKKESEDTDGT